MEQEKPFQERRKYIRLKTSVEVNYTIIGEPGAVKVFSKNISAGGICLLANKEVVQNTPLQLEFKIPDLKDPIRALGRVVWQKKFASVGEETKISYDTGIEFTGISDFDRFNINRYVLDRVEPQAEK